MASKINLISNALILIGDTSINSLTGNDRRQEVANNLYDNIVQAELSTHYWGFARRKAQISITTDTLIDNEYKSVYQLPSDLITLIKVYPNIDYERYGDQIYCNYTQKLTCDYIANVAESEWPVYFAKTVEYALAKDFATSIKDSASARQEMQREYLFASRKARTIDSQQRKTRPIQSSPFLDVRN